MTAGERGAFYDSQQRHAGSIGIYLDVTLRKQLEARLRKARAVAEISTEARQRFLANVSHKTRTPTNAIVGECEKCLVAGTNDYLTKPFEEVVLLKMVYKRVVGYQPPPTASPGA